MGVTLLQGGCGDFPPSTHHLLPKGDGKKRVCVHKEPPVFTGEFPK